MVEYLQMVSDCLQCSNYLQKYLQFLLLLILLQPSLYLLNAVVTLNDRLPARTGVYLRDVV